MASKSEKLSWCLELTLWLFEGLSDEEAEQVAQIIQWIDSDGELLGTMEQLNAEYDLFDPPED